MSLTTAFLDHAPAPLRAGLARLDLEEILAGWAAAGDAAWPGIGLDPAAFVGYVAERLSPAADPATALDGLCVTDLWLAAGCAAQDRAALAQFDARLGAQLRGALAPMNLGADQVDEVAQELRRKLLVADGGAPRIADYSGRADLRTWLRTAAVRTAIDLLRKQRDVLADDDVMAALPAIDDDPALLHAKQLYRAELAAAFRDALPQLDARDRVLLKYQFVDGLSIDRIGAIYGVHRATAARWLAGAREALATTVQRLLLRKLGVSPSDLASIARLVESQLDLSIRRLL
jgi:RNA polymerase sigma-70 factor, ECF subfamily